MLFITTTGQQSVGWDSPNTAQGLGSLATSVDTSAANTAQMKFSNGSGASVSFDWLLLGIVP